MRFYGGRPSDWAAMPLRMARACMSAMPRLKAQETLSLMTAVALGTGSMKKVDLERTLREMRRQAGYSAAQKPASLEELKTRLAAMGIGFEVAKRGG